MNKPVRVTGIVAIVFAVIFVVAGAATWGVITSQLRAERITVPADSSIMAGARVQGPITAFAQAQTIQKHATGAADGKTYGELSELSRAAQEDGNTAEAEKYGQLTDTVMTASFLRASLFTSVVAYGVALLVVGLGVILALLGWALLALAKAKAPATASAD